ncbi:hypothetical protein J6Z39_06700 [bacterium]|nr:hypothetical protein [bacterium]
MANLDAFMFLAAFAGYIFNAVVWLALRDMPVFEPEIGKFPDLFFFINSFFMIIAGLQAERFPNLRKLLILCGGVLCLTTSVYILAVFPLFFRYRFTIFGHPVAFYNLIVLLLIFSAYTIKSRYVKK